MLLETSTKKKDPPEADLVPKPNVVKKRQKPVFVFMKPVFV